MQQFNRLAPQLPPEAMKTYQAVVPKNTHLREATCEETNCPNYLHGWKTVVDESNELGQQQAYYIRKLSDRKFTQQRENDLTTFVFEAGQTCFGAHSVPLEREPLYLVRQGDWRGNPRQEAPRQHANAAEWVEDFSTHQDKLAKELS